MRYRRLTDGDANFGGSQADFHRDTAEGVAQAVRTRLALEVGDFFLDLAEGIDWRGKVLGTGTAGLYDLAVRARILGTQGVRGLADYASQRNGNARRLAIQATIDTVYGPVALTPAHFVRPPLTGSDSNTVPLNSSDGVLLLSAAGVQLTGRPQG